MCQNKKCVLFLILLVVPLGGVGIDLYSASMPNLAYFFSISQAKTKMTLTFFLLGFSIGLLIFGILSDCYGRKKFQVLNSLIFMLSSFLMTLQSSIEAIFVLRFLQGLSAGGLAAIARSIITDVFARNEITKISLYVTSVWGLGPVIAPWIGGLLAHHYSWRVCFYLFAAYGLLAFLANFFFLKESHSNQKQLRFDVLYRDIFSIMKQSYFIVPVFVMSLSYSILICYGVIGSYFIEVHLNYSTIAYGNIGLGLGFGYLIGTLICRILIEKVSDDFLLKFTLYSMFILNLLLLLLSYIYVDNIILLIAEVFISCFFVGFIYPIYMAKSVKAFVNKAGIASGVTTASIMLLSSLFSFLLSSIKIVTQTEFQGIYFLLSIAMFFVWYFFSKKQVSLDHQPEVRVSS